MKRLFSKRNLNRLCISVFCAVIAVIVCYVLGSVYKPNQNAYGAIASVSMDAVCMLLILILIVNQIFEKDEPNRTTKLFLTLMLATYWALFMDLMTWSLDGSLAYDSMGYVYTVLSLCMGSILALFFVLYLGCYLKEMYDIKNVMNHARICAVVNFVSFVITLLFALTKQGFIFVDGHYEIGSQYDIVTAIPVLTVLYMMLFTVRNVKKIGLHDNIAVVGYISIMIAGALLEATYRMGTTFVGVTIANAFIFVMLQSKWLDRAREQRETLAERFSSQFAILESMAGIYSYVNDVDLENQKVKRFDQLDSVEEPLDLSKDSHSNLNHRLLAGMNSECKEDFWAYTDLSTLPRRIGKEKTISAEFYHTEEGWLRAQYIRIGDPNDSVVKKVIYTIQNINEEKKNVEKWIRRSNMDELTGIFNRNAYENDLAELEAEEVKDDFVYVSLDVNGLKGVNDTLGHAAGDEIIIGAGDCLKQCFEAYGKLYRTGGDEFAALIYAEEAQLTEIIKDLERVTKKWRGIRNEQLTMSCGYVTRREAGRISIREMAILADKRMYENKAEYYKHITY